MRYKNTYIWLEQDLFNHLEATIEKYNLHLCKEDKNRINIDMAVFFIHYIRLKTIQYKDKLIYGYVRLHSEFLNDYLKDNLKKYRTFLKGKGYIKTIPYHKENGKSIGYKVMSLKKIKQFHRPKKKYIVYEFISQSYESFLNKKIEKNEGINRRKKVADRTTKHLTKWLNKEHIKIDWEGAYKWIDENTTLSDEKKFFYSYSVEKLRFNIWQYSRSGKDNRLHSNLTNFPSKLRRFITNIDTKLVSLDIKSSQPFILAGVFNLLTIDKCKLKELLDKIKSTKVKNTCVSIMYPESSEPFEKGDFERYIDLVCNSDIYNHVADNLDENFITSIKSKHKYGKYEDLVYNRNTETKEVKYFDDLRSYCKTLTLEYMYCSVENNSERIKQIKKIYPEAVNQFIYNFKYCKDLDVPRNKRTKRNRDRIKRVKTHFSLFLQQIEAAIMLDIITKELSKIYPQMFMVTIHDSIVVPIKYAQEVKLFLTNRLFEIFNIDANIKEEKWY